MQNEGGWWARPGGGRWLFVVAMIGLALGGCDEESAPPGGPDGSVVMDGGGGGVDAAAGACAEDSDCDDGVFCNGAERCAPEEDGADAGGCVAPTEPACMPSQTCDEGEERCLSECDTEGDADGDGRESIACGGDDCDDSDPNRYPGNVEICDVDDHDEDCDPSTYGFRDGDGDGAPDTACCNVAEDGTRSCGTDCNDASTTVHPTASELCDGVDNDCDESIDEGATSTYWPDSDGDGFGSMDPAAEAMEACFTPDGHADNARDCDDGRSAVNPGNAEVCDEAGLDEDCDGAANPDSLCSCTGSGSRPCQLQGVCSNGTETCSGGRWGSCSISPVSEVCNGLNDDCDGQTDEGVTIQCFDDFDNDGYAVAGATESARCPDASRVDVGGCPAFTTNRLPMATDLDCDDAVATRRPGAVEACNGLDDDCDGRVDEGVSVTCYPDSDGDTYAAAGAPAMATCAVAGREFVGGCAVGSTNRSPADAVDCDDGRSYVNPEGSEECNGIDDDCNDMIDDGVLTTFYEDSDGDGFGSMDPGAATTQACFRPAGYQPDATDCDDGSSGVNPGLPEVCDSMNVDENCDGVTNPEELCMCTGSDSRPCQRSGACAAGTETCSSGAWGACSISPVSETCNEVDDDCDGSTDEGLTVTCYSDADNDGYAAGSAQERQECPDSGRVDVGGCPAFTTNRAPLDVDIDCNDGLSTTRPGAAEACNGVDDDCDGETDEGVAVVCYADSDGDTYALADAVATDRCPASGREFVGGCPLGTTNRSPATSPDCNDASSAVSPAASEACDGGGASGTGVDDDCDGSVNEGCDCINDEVRACDSPGRCASGTQTCSGGSWGSCTILPASEICNGEDDDCNGSIDEGTTVTCYADPDDDGYAADGTAAETSCPATGRGHVGGCPFQTTNLAPVDDSTTDCHESNASAHPAGNEVCDGASPAVDEDCDGTANPADLCACVDGTTQPCPEPGICSEGMQTCTGGQWGSCSIAPQTETCDGEDDDCDGTVDDGVSVTCYQDEDGDTYAPMAASPQQECPVGTRPSVGGCPVGTTNRAPVTGSIDCDDDPTSGASINPAAEELCDGDGVDEDCDGTADEDPPCRCTNGDTRSCPEQGICATGQQTCSGGTWGSCSVSPGAESCNGSDDDCDGDTDEGVTTTCYEDPDNDTYASATAPAESRCGCGTGWTDREPVSPDIDCRPTDGNSYPGASEICDRLDNDCSSGGGSVPAEDWDGDGHAPPGAVCTGGFDKDDCYDRNANVYPGQTSWFSTGYCRTGCPLTCEGELRCIGGGGQICRCATLDYTEPSFDYDCDGSDETQPAASCGCSFPLGCGTSGPRLASAGAACGEPITYRSCLGTCGSGCSHSDSASEMGCH